MKNILIAINRWDNPLSAKTSIALQEGDVVIAETQDGTAAATVRSADSETASRYENAASSITIVRKANINDLKAIEDFRSKEKDALKACRDEIKRQNLPMKLVDAAYAFDGGSITFAFIADGRVDFRELVKNLSKVFQRSIRLHQIGARDESRQCGGYGICGREQCCVKFKGNLPSISSEMAKVQQISHRGSERISGICGRLMCCLAYEAEQYRQLAAGFPKIGEEISSKSGSGLVKDVNLMSGEIKLELKDKSIVFINNSELK